jgi:hypothetical protein
MNDGIISIQFAIIKNEKMIAFGLTKEMLIEELTKIKSRLKSGVYYISEVLDYQNKQEFVKTSEYIVLL